jgi:hypothetical protein
VAKTGLSRAAKGEQTAGAQTPKNRLAIPGQRYYIARHTFIHSAQGVFQWNKRHFRIITRKSSAIVTAAAGKTTMAIS